MSESLYVPLAVVGLSILAVIITGFYQRYEADQAIRRTLVQKEIRIINEIEELLSALSNAGLPPDFRKILRMDIVERYTRITNTYPKYPNLSKLMLAAGEKMKAESQQQGTVPTLQAPEELAKYTSQINNFIRHLNETPFAYDVKPETTPKLVEQLGECRAQLCFNFYTTQAKTLQESGETLQAKKLLGELNGILSKKGPNTDKVRNLFEKSKQLFNEKTPDAKEEKQEAVNQTT